MKLIPTESVSYLRLARLFKRDLRKTDGVFSLCLEQLLFCCALLSQKITSFFFSYLFGTDMQDSRVEKSERRYFKSHQIAKRRKGYIKKTFLLKAFHFTSALSPACASNNSLYVFSCFFFYNYISMIIFLVIIFLMHFSFHLICFFYHNKQIDIEFYFTGKTADTSVDTFPLNFHLLLNTIKVKF